MKRSAKSIEDILNDSLPSASTEQTEAACDRILNRLQSADWSPSRPSPVVFDSLRARRRTIATIAFVAAALLVAFLLGITCRHSRLFAVVQTSNGVSYRIPEGKTYSINGVVTLPDGSRVEARAGSELSFERADGLRIRLVKGSIIVNAVKQASGHFYVQTKDMVVSVVGTVFWVNTEEAGSRAAVIQGEVQVQQGAKLTKLLPGEQIATSRLMESRTVKEEIAWSRYAEEHLALLQQFSAQTEKRLEFEVASVKLNRSGSRYSRSTSQPDGGFIATNVTLRGLIVDAYPFKSFQVTGGTAWIDSDRFDIVAKAPEKSTEDEYQARLRNLLEDRFKIVVHTETRDRPIYVLVPARSNASTGLQLKPSSQNCATPRMRTSYTAAGGTINGVCSSLRDLAESLVGVVDRMVLDRTGLTSTFDYELRWASDTTGDTPSLFTALQEQLGLKLEASRGTVEMLVVDSAQHPEPN